MHFHFHTQSHLRFHSPTRILGIRLILPQKDSTLSAPFHLLHSTLFQPFRNDRRRSNDDVSCPCLSALPPLSPHPCCLLYVNSNHLGGNAFSWSATKDVYRPTIIRLHFPLHLATSTNTLCLIFHTLPPISLQNDNAHPYHLHPSAVFLSNNTARSVSNQPIPRHTLSSRAEVASGRSEKHRRRSQLTFQTPVPRVAKMTAHCLWRSTHHQHPLSCAMLGFHWVVNPRFSLSIRPLRPCCQCMMCLPLLLL